MSAMIAIISTIAKKLFPYDHNNHPTFFSAIVVIAVIIAIIWKPAFNVTMFNLTWFHFIMWEANGEYFGLSAE